jgi:hypothetical protein
VGDYITHLTDSGKCDRITLSWAETAGQYAWNSVQHALFQGMLPGISQILRMIYDFLKTTHLMEHSA